MNTTAEGNGARFDVTSLGEAMLRLSVPEGRRLANTRNLDVNIGGAESNVCAALACLERKVGWVSQVPRNDLGALVLRAMQEANINVDAVSQKDDLRQGLYFVEYAGPPRTTHVTYDRAGSAAANMTSDSIDWTGVSI